MTSKEILPPCLGQVIEQTKRTHSSLGNIFWKQKRQLKSMEENKRKQLKMKLKL